MRVLIGGERFGHIRNAYRKRGHDAWSCDYAPDATGSPYHLQGNYEWFAENIEPFDMAIFHPDCTYTCSSGLHWNKRRPEREALTQEAVNHVSRLQSVPLDRVVIEQPIGRIGTALDWSGWNKQIVQPYMFGDDASKATVLYSRGVPPLVIPPESAWFPPRIVFKDGKSCKRWSNQTDSGQNRLGPSDTRAMERAETYPGIANAMADQWNF